jgi:hypothetical protein
MGTAPTRGFAGSKKSLSRELNHKTRPLGYIYLLESVARQSHTPTDLPPRLQLYLWKSLLAIIKPSNSDFGLCVRNQS